MAQKFDSGYSKMLSAPASFDGPRKDTIESLQKQIDFHVVEANRLKYVRNSHVAVSLLPPELLSEVFLYVVEFGQKGNTRFAPGTFGFLQVCRGWNEVAIGFPQLWGFWVAGAAKAWSLFNSRSKGGPLSLTWRYRLPRSARDALTDPDIPGRTRQLDFNGFSDQLDHFLGIFDSSPPSDVLSIRLQITQRGDSESRERLDRLLFSSFPKLSKLNVGNFLPKPSSPIFKTSKLTSLKLFVPYGERSRYDLAQFSQILRHHPTLQELDLNHGAIPLRGRSGVLVPFVLPRLTNFRLHGTKGSIFGLIDLIGMSSPLHNVSIRFTSIPKSTTPVLTSIMEKILVAYYGCQGLDHPRKIDNLTISKDLIFDARSPTSNLKLQFQSGYEVAWHNVVEESLTFIHSSDIQEFTIEGLPLSRRMLEEMKYLSHLRLCGQVDKDIDWSFDVLAFSRDLRRQSAPELESLTLSHLEILYVRRRQLLSILKEWRDRNFGLKHLAVRSCRIHGTEVESKLKGLVKNVKWDNVRLVSPYGILSDSDSEEASDGTPSEDSDTPDEDIDLCEEYRKCSLYD